MALTREQLQVTIEELNDKSKTSGRYFLKNLKDLPMGIFKKILLNKKININVLINGRTLLHILYSNRNFNHIKILLESNRYIFRENSQIGIILNCNNYEYIKLLKNNSSFKSFITPWHYRNCFENSLFNSLKSLIDNIVDITKLKYDQSCEYSFYSYTFHKFLINFINDFNNYKETIDLYDSVINSELSDECKLIELLKQFEINNLSKILVRKFGKNLKSLSLLYRDDLVEKILKYEHYNLIRSMINDTDKNKEEGKNLLNKLINKKLFNAIYFSITLERLEEQRDYD